MAQKTTTRKRRSRSGVKKISINHVQEHNGELFVFAAVPAEQWPSGNITVRDSTLDKIERFITGREWGFLDSKHHKMIPCWDFKVL